MPLAIAPYILGTHVFFFREGDAFTVPGAGTAARESKPGATDPAWIPMGVVEESADNIENTQVEIYAPSPGRAVLYDSIGTKDKLMVKFTCSELSPLVIESLYRTLPLTAASTQFNPLEGRDTRGWLKIQRYDQNNAQRVVMDLYCQLKITGDLAMGGGDLVRAQFEALVLHSTLNTGTL